MSTLPFLSGYSGQSTIDLISLEGEYRTDSLVLAFESALMNRANLTQAETAVLAVEALEREVNNGGFRQFLTNASNQYASVLAASLSAIDCPQTASLAQRAVETLGSTDLQNPEAIERAVFNGGDSLAAALDALTARYFEMSSEPIAERLFEYIKANQASVRASEA